MTALAALHELVEQRASGELICVARAGEVHVFLQGGRIAWATDSAAPFAFGRHLLERGSLTREAFSEVLESCRRDRLPLGETLIAWRMATLEEIRDALRQQVLGALITLTTEDAWQTIFLERTRQYATYDVRLTFPLDELAPDGGARHELLERLATEAPDATWFELFERARSVGREPPAARARVPRALLDRSVLDGAALAVLRSGRGTYLGVRVDAARSVWCRLDPEAAFGATLSVVAAASAAWADGRGADGDPPPESSLQLVPTRDDAPPLQTLGAHDDAAGAPFLEFLGAAPEVSAAVVEDDGALVGAVRGEVDGGWLRDLVRRRRDLLRAGLPRDGASTPLEDLGYRLRSVATAEPQVWCFGAELAGEGRRSVWMLTDRNSSQALGWAYLTSLARRIEGVTGPTRRELNRAG